jgi:hypothetical protein
MRCLSQLSNGDASFEPKLLVACTAILGEFGTKEPVDVKEVNKIGVFTAIGAAKFYFCILDLLRCGSHSSLDDISTIVATVNFE